MAEIRSTLDLVMERTKNLALTDGEKRELRRRELEGRLRGLAQKSLDGRLTIDETKADFKSIAAGREGEARELLKKILADHIDPEGDYGRVLEILRVVLGMETGPLEEAFRSLQEEIASAREGYLERTKESLACRVSGTAVVPNLSRSPEWQEFRKKSAAALKGRLLSQP
ncbi:MAG: hypothetical protein KBG01_04810 [Syntrophobacterales bacterium]|nr:hypothetical protein [Syntrophobacterales bacterium]